MFSFCYAHVLQINPLLPFFDIFSGTQVRPRVQVATPLLLQVTQYMILVSICVTSTARVTSLNKERSCQVCKTFLLTPVPPMK